MEASGQRYRPTRALSLRDGLLVGVLLLLGLTLNVTRLGAASMFGDEAIYAVAARNAAVHGDWYPLRYEQQLAVSKPPLAMWTMAASFALFGVSETSARLPNALIAALLSCLIFVYARFALDRIFACFAAVMFSTCPPWLVEHGARAAVIESLLCSTLLAAFAAYLLYRRSGQRSWAGAAACCVGLAGMSKGVVGPLIFVVATTLYEVSNRLLGGFDGRSRTQDEHEWPAHHRSSWCAPLVIFLIGICPYLLWVIDTINRVPNYPTSLYADIVTRVTSGLDPSHLHSVSYYGYVLSYALDHWGLALLLVGVALAFRYCADCATQTLRLAAICTCVVVVLGSCAASKLPWYVYPALPAMAILVAAAASAIFANLRSSILRIVAAIIFCMLLASRIAVAWTAINAPARVIDMQRLAHVVRNNPQLHFFVDLRARSNPQFREWNAFYLDQIEDRIENLPASLPGGCSAVLTDRSGTAAERFGSASARAIPLLKYDARETQLTVLDHCAGAIAKGIRETP